MRPQIVDYLREEVVAVWLKVVGTWLVVEEFTELCRLSVVEGLTRRVAATSTQSTAHRRAMYSWRDITQRLVRW